MDELIAYLNPIKKFTANWIDGNKLWVQQYPFDSWTHPFFSDTTIDVEAATKLKNSFDKKLYNDKYFSDFEHGLDRNKGSKASGEVLELKVVEEARGVFSSPGLWGLVQFTDTAKQEIDAGEWNYWSAEHYDEFTHPQKGTKDELVFSGGALTNKPYVKGMAPLNFSELGMTETEVKEHAVLTAAERKGLPDSAYMYIAPDGTRMFPFKHSDGSLDKTHLEKIVQLAPRAKVPDNVKARVISRAKKLLGNDSKSYSDEVINFDESLTVDEAKELVDNPEWESIEDKESVVALATKTDEGGDKDVELEKQLREKLGLAEDADILKFVGEMHDEVVPMREALKAHNEKKAFSEMFPAEAKRMEELESKEQERQAKAFSESFSKTRLTKKEGDEDKSTTLGFSALVLDEIQGLAKAFNENTADLPGVKKVLDAITNNGIVDYGDLGSTREDEKTLNDVDIVPSGGVAATRKAFAEKVTNIMKEDKVEYMAAVRLAADKYPVLADAYHSVGMGTSSE